jgi:hypothetical protein
MEAPNIEIPRYDQKKYGINLEEFKYDENITPELIMPQLNDLLQKLNLTNQFKGSTGEKLLNNPNFFSFMNNYFFPAENFLNEEVYPNPIKMKNYILTLDELLISILNNPSQLDSINGDKIDLGKLVKYMCVIFFKKPDLLKKIKKFIEKAFNIKKLKTLEYVLQNTSNTEWNLSKETSQQKKRASETQNMDTSKKQKIQTPNLKKRPRSKDDGVDSMETLMKKMDIGEEEKMLQEGGMMSEDGDSTTTTTAASTDLTIPDQQLADAGTGTGTGTTNSIGIINVPALNITSLRQYGVTGNTMGQMDYNENPNLVKPPSSQTQEGLHLSTELVQAQNANPIADLTQDQRSSLNQDYQNFQRGATDLQRTSDQAIYESDKAFVEAHPGTTAAQYIAQQMVPNPQQGEEEKMLQEGGMMSGDDDSTTPPASNILPFTDNQLAGPPFSVQNGTDPGTGTDRETGPTSPQTSMGIVSNRQHQQTSMPIVSDRQQTSMQAVQHRNIGDTKQTLSIKPSLIRVVQERLKDLIREKRQILDENERVIDELNRQDPEWFRGKFSGSF